MVRPPSEPVDLRIGGHPVVAVGEDPPAGASLDSGFDQGTALGKRYVDEATGLEVLCTKAGEGSLSIGDTPLPTKDAKPLPSSD